MNKYEKKHMRNGEVDILRLVFAISIMCFHFTVFENNIFEKGYIGVEFFFVLTGYFMTLGVTKELDHDGLDNLEVWEFLKNKVKVFYPYLFSAWLLNLIVRISIEKYSFRSIVSMILKSLPTLLNIQILINTEETLALTGAWYLSAMMVSLWFMYPLNKKLNKWSTRVFFPIVSLLLYRYVLGGDGSLNKVWDVIYNIPQGMLRAIADIGVGCFLYEVVFEVDKICISKKNCHIFKTLLTIIKYMLYICVFGFAEGELFSEGNSDIYIFIVLCVALSLSFSKSTYCIKSNSITDFCGKLSLSIYLTHGIVRYVVGYFDIVNSMTALFFSYILSIIVAILLVVLIDYMKIIIKHRVANSANKVST